MRDSKNVRSDRGKGWPPPFRDWIFAWIVEVTAGVWPALALARIGSSSSFSSFRCTKGVIFSERALGWTGSSSPHEGSFENGHVGFG